MTTPEFAALLANQLPGFFPIDQGRSRALRRCTPTRSSGLNEGRETGCTWAWEGCSAGTPDGYTLMQDNAIAVLGR